MTLVALILSIAALLVGLGDLAHGLVMRRHGKQAIVACPLIQDKR